MSIENYNFTLPKNEDDPILDTINRENVPLRLSELIEGPEKKASKVREHPIVILEDKVSNDANEELLREHTFLANRLGFFEEKYSASDIIQPYLDLDDSQLIKLTEARKQYYDSLVVQFASTLKLEEVHSNYLVNLDKLNQKHDWGISIEQVELTLQKTSPIFADPLTHPNISSKSPMMFDRKNIIFFIESYELEYGLDEDDIDELIRAYTHELTHKLSGRTLAIKRQGGTTEAKQDRLGLFIELKEGNESSFSVLFGEAVNEQLNMMITGQENLEITSYKHFIMFLRALIQYSDQVLSFNDFARAHFESKDPTKPAGQRSPYMRILFRKINQVYGANFFRKVSLEGIPDKESEFKNFLRAHKAN